MDGTSNNGAPAEQAEPATAEAPKVVDYKAKLLALLGLDGAADDAAIDAAAAELAKAPAKLAEIEKAKTMAEVDELLAEYEMPEESAKAMRELAVSNRDQAKKLLGAMPKKAPKVEAAPEVPAGVKAEVAKAVVPAKPMHDPRAEEVKVSDTDKAAEADKLIATIRKAGKFPTYEAARNEARRQKPDLFS